MAKTTIEYVDRTWNPVTGCSPVSPACANCYAERMAKRLAGRYGYAADEPFRVTLHEDRLDEPLRWRKPSRVFVCSMGDLFHEDVPVGWIEYVFNTMASVTANCGKNHDHEEECWCGPPHTFLVLTKRPERAKALIEEELPFLIGECWPGDSPIAMADWPLPNVWLGVTAEDQRRADERIPILLDTPAAKRFVSCEPLLGPVDLRRYMCGPVEEQIERMGPPLDWVIVGAETGPGARPMKPMWAEGLFHQCRGAGVPFFWKKGTPGIAYQYDMTVWREFPS